MASAEPSQAIKRCMLRQVLGHASADLVDRVANQARARGISLYLVGGVVRDLMLKIKSHDLDFALEADAKRFADELVAAYGGSALAHRAFGTAVWTLDARLAAAGKLPEHIDFVRARSESYAHPAALPTVAFADIQSDMRRRDFTLNALAIQLSPGVAGYRLLDACGGLDDLQKRLIRVLHGRSFIDDPTRILRAIRLGERLGFTIEAETMSLLRAALPLLQRVTGNRLASELDLILGEPRAGAMLQTLQELGALREIQPAFCISPALSKHLARLPERDRQDRAIAWTLFLAQHKRDDAAAICQRLDLPKALTDSAIACAGLMQHAELLNDANSPPSHTARLLDGLPEAALEATRLQLAERPIAVKRIGDYLDKWRHQRAITTGHDLARLGLPPGPRYKEILDTLRFAWIDGEIRGSEDEQDRLAELLKRDALRP